MFELSCLSITVPVRTDSIVGAICNSANEISQRRLSVFFFSGCFPLGTIGKESERTRVEVTISRSTIRLNGWYRFIHTSPHGQLAYSQNSRATSGTEASFYRRRRLWKRDEVVPDPDCLLQQSPRGATLTGPLWPNSAVPSKTGGCRQRVAVTSAKVLPSSFYPTNLKGLETSSGPSLPGS